MLVAVVLMLQFTSCGKKIDSIKTQNQTDSTKTDSVKKETGKDQQLQQKNGVDTFLTVGYMYWVPPAILDEHWSAVIAGEVVSIEKRRIGETDPNKNEVFGMVKIDKVMLSEPTENMNMQNQKYIRTDALKGFKPGDKVLIYFVKHEKGYAIKRDNVKKISGQDDELVGLTQRYISNSQNPESFLNDPKEYRLWGKYDVGNASRLMQEREDKNKGADVKK